MPAPCIGTKVHVSTQAQEMLATNAQQLEMVEGLYGYGLYSYDRCGHGSDELSLISTPHLPLKSVGSR